LWIFALMLAVATAGQVRAKAEQMPEMHTQVEAFSHPGQASDKRACMPAGPPVALLVGQSRHLRLVERAERTRWNARPTVASVQASAAGMHWVRALSPGFTEVEFMLGSDDDRHADRNDTEASEGAGLQRCLSLRIEVALDLSAPRSLIRSWAEGLARDPLMPSPEVVLEAREHLLVLQGEVARADQSQALEALLRAWIETQPGTRPQLLNWVKVRSPEQIMLEVRIAEVSSRLLDKLGVDWSIGRQTPVRARLGQWTAEAGFANAGAALLTLMRGSGLLAIDAEALRSEWRLLAQPNLMAQSGMEGQFLAGGKVFIPVSIQQGQGEQLNVTTRLDEREYGVSLKFTPTVLADGRVQLKVAPEVSELSREGVLVSAGERGSVLPLVTLRKASTTITLSDGESFVVGGLLSQGSEDRRRGLPGLIDLPFLGALFGASDAHGNRTELVFVVTPKRVGRKPPTAKVSDHTAGGMQ
jgi:Flp pilus assembly secretin CpaC